MWRISARQRQATKHQLRWVIHMKMQLSKSNTARYEKRKRKWNNNGIRKSIEGNIATTSTNYKNNRNKDIYSESTGEWWKCNNNNNKNGTVFKNGIETRANNENESIAVKSCIHAHVFDFTYSNRQMHIQPPSESESEPE